MNSSYDKIVQLNAVITQKSKSINISEDLQLIQTEIREIKGLLRDAIKKSNILEYENILHIAERWNSFFAFWGKPMLLTNINRDNNYGQTNDSLKYLKGVVISHRMDKTAVVRTQRFEKDKKYNKYVINSRKYHVHDSYNACKVGDVILFVQSRPFSKTKHHRLYKRLIGENASFL